MQASHSPLRNPIMGLDLCKGISAILIVFHHYQQGFGCHFSHVNFYESCIPVQRLVEFFFMISGFLAIYTLRRDQSYTVQFTRRLARIYPMATVALACSLFIRTLSLRLQGDTQGIRDLFDVVNLFSNITLTFRGNLAFDRMGVNNPTWYLCVLIVCLLLFYLIVRFCDRYRMPLFLAFLAVVLFSAAARHTETVPRDLLRGTIPFFFGAALYLALERYDGFLVRRRKPLILLFLILLILSASLILFFGTYSRLFCLYLAFPSAILLAYLFRDLQCRAVSLFGKVSFEVYLWHEPMIELLMFILLRTGLPFTHSHLTMLLFTLTVEGTAYLLYRFAETPLNRLVKKLLARAERA